MEPDKGQDTYKGLQIINETLVRIHWLDEAPNGPGWHWRVGHDLGGPFATSKEAFGGASRALGGQDE